MDRVRKFMKVAIVTLAILLGAQIAASMIVRTGRMRAYLTARLGRTFGRPVEVGRFSVQILPTPQLDIAGVTIGEDPSFGREYFLRAEHLDASLRWMGLLRGHFEFGTISLSRPSLILVRSPNGRWNLEDWLPPAGNSSANGTRQMGPGQYGPSQPAETANHLRKIEFDDGRINFKLGDEKRPFAFRSVSGSVEQVAPGRWQLQLEAEPWRSGIELQTTGLLQVNGDVAGTSSRLQPAQIRVHWGRVSLADLSRLIMGTDSGVRGEIALDGEASIGNAPLGEQIAFGKWKFLLAARVAQVHRWNLTERSDNPQISAKFAGIWDVAAGKIRADEMSVELPHSNLHGSAEIEIADVPRWSLRVNSAAVTGEDVLACYRAYQPDVADGMSLEQFFRGAATASGWPLQWSSAKISSEGGLLKVPGVAAPLQVSALAGGMKGQRFVLEPVHITAVASVPGLLLEAVSKNEKLPTRTRATQEARNSAEISVAEDFAAHEGMVQINAQLADVTDVFRVSNAFGYTLNHGWELSGAAAAAMGRDWQPGLVEGRWNGTIRLSRAELQTAGLNEPIRIDDGVLGWQLGQRSVVLTKAQAFGTNWNGTIEDLSSRAVGEEPRWKFQLHADRLDATELDRWFGPRGRPTWLERLLPSLLGGKSGGGVTNASELLREVRAEGELEADSLTIEKLKLAHARARLEIHALQVHGSEMECTWAGGTIRGSFQGVFSAKPRYEIAGEFEGLNLAQLPWASRWGGVAGGKLRLTTEGVGRDALLRGLAGRGEVKLSPVEFRGWDAEASLESGAAKAGASHWTSGEGKFSIENRELTLVGMQLDAVRVKTRVEGKIGFGQEGDFTFAPFVNVRRVAGDVGVKKVLWVSGPLDAPKGSMVAVDAEKAKP
jgi:AsmA family